MRFPSLPCPDGWARFLRQVVLLLALAPGAHGAPSAPSAPSASPAPSAQPSPVAADLAAWRADAARIRTLAENDVPKAYEQARRLQASLPPDAAPADHALALNLLARVETYAGLTGPAAIHAREAFAIAVRSGDRVGQAESDLNVAINSINLGHLDDLVTATTHAVSVLEGVDRPDLLGEAMLRLAVMYRRFDQFEESVAVAVQAMEIARRSNNPIALAYAHHGLAIAYDQSYRFPESRQHYLQMREAARLAHSRLDEGFAVAGLASNARAVHDLAGAERLGREALAIFHSVGAPFAESFAMFGLAGTLEEEGRRADALQLIDESLDIYRQHPNPIGTWFSLNARSRLFESGHDMPAARADAEQAYAIAKGLGVALYVSGSARRLAGIDAAAGDWKEAYARLREAQTLTERSAREKASARMLQLTQRYESESKQRQIEELTRRNEQQTAQLRQRELQQAWLWTGLAGTAAVLVLTAFFLLRLRRSRRTLQALNVALAASRDAVRALNADLEQRVQARTSELRQQARYLRTMIDMLPMWAWFKDTRNRYLVTNQSYAQARGRAPEDLVGRSDAEVLPAPLAAASADDDEQVMTTREQKTTEERVADGDAEAWMETYKAPVLDEDGTVLGTVGIARDISDRKTTEAAREAALDEARRLARLRSEFLARMSHELRTPLTAILGFANLLLGDRRLDEHQSHEVSIIRQSGEHLLALINDILDLARVDAGRLEVVPGDIDLRGMLRVVADIVRVKADEKRLAFELRLDESLPSHVRGDELRLRQVLLNLLSNAVKFTEAGRVTLCVRDVTPVHERAADAPARLAFSVEDTGTGMSETQLVRIFEPFEQVGDARSRSGGAGLGLAISRQLVSLMGGDLRVRSRPGQGSVFSFELAMPVADVAARAARASGRITGYEGPRRRVLVADDAPALRELMAATLRDSGFVVSLAADGQQCVEAAARERPDLIVMDLAMPVMDGLATMRHLRAQGALADVPIIATSASVLDAEARSRAAGADAFVPKPVDAERLLRLIGERLGLRWIHERAGTAGSTSPAVDGPPERLVFPPEEEMAELRRLARIGNMRDLCARAEHVRAMGAPYTAFADRLRGLAESFQSQAIMALVGPSVPADAP